MPETQRPQWLLNAVTVDQLILSRLLRQPAARIAALPALQAMGDLLIRDSLTGLYNRRYLDERLPLELAAAGERRESLSLLVMDLNGFKQTNDTLGHAAGDRLLAAVAGVLLARLPRGAFACRHGGDEFVLVLPRWGRVDALGWAALVLDELGRAEVDLAAGGRAEVGLAAADRAGGKQVMGIGASIGVATWPDSRKRRPGCARGGTRPSSGERRNWRYCKGPWPKAAA